MVSVMLHNKQLLEQFIFARCTVSTSLVIAKTKVASLKTVTIPKLELSSAVLLSKLLFTVCKEFGIKPCKMFAWCDSTVALGWISTSPHKLKTFVANRVVSITENIPATQWRHVSSADNLADIGSRGCTFKNLVGSVCGGMDHPGYFFHLINACISQSKPSELA